MPDLEITCAECGELFLFNEREQYYYRGRGLSHPKRCQACREVRRANIGTNSRMHTGPKKFEIVCVKCGKTDYVRFKPEEGRPVLCGECFMISKS